MNDTLAVDGMTTPEQVLSRTPNGSEMLRIGRALGLVSTTINQKIERQAFIRNISDLGPKELSDQQSLWASEYGRLCELHGLLIGQRDHLNLQMRSAKARARSRARSRLADDSSSRKPPTATELNDLAEEDSTVQKITEQLGVVELLAASTSAAKEATDRYLQALSREISFRCTQIEARIY